MKKSIIAGSLAAVLGVTGVAGSVAGHNAHAAQQPQFKYTVKTGDTLSEIGEKFNVSVSQLKQWNGLHSDIIIVDQKLTIYVQPQNQNQNQQTYTNNTTQYSQNVQSQQTNQTNQSYNQAQNVQQAPQQSSQSTQHAEQVRTQKAPVSTQTQAPKQAQVTSYQAQKQVTNYQVPKQAPKQVTSNTTQSSSSGGSVKAQFLANGGTESAWNTIVMPESGGNPNAVSPTGYRGLGQTMESWGTGSVAQQTKGMINYANNRYGSLEAATAFRAAHGWW